GRAADQHNLAGEIDGDHRVRALAATVTFGIGRERREIENGEIGNEAGEIGSLGTDQQLTNEKGVPGEFGIDARLDPVFRVGPTVEILRKELFALGRLDEVGKQIVEVLLRRLVITVPPE